MYLKRQPRPNYRRATYSLTQILNQTALAGKYYLLYSFWKILLSLYAFLIVRKTMEMAASKKGRFIEHFDIFQSKFVPFKMFVPFKDALMKSAHRNPLKILCKIYRKNWCIYLISPFLNFAFFLMTLGGTMQLDEMPMMAQ